MSAALGWAIYAAMGALVTFVPPTFMKIEPSYIYRQNLWAYVKALGGTVLGFLALFVLVHLGMWAGDLVSGK